jgi:hypothetical protein
VLLSTSASSSSASATCSWEAGGRTVLSCAFCVKTIESVASMIAPGEREPERQPEGPAAEFTPAASLTRSSEIGDSV